MDNMLRFRDMVANNAVAEIWDETRKLADVYGIDGAILYLRMQIKFLHDVREAEEMEGDDFGDEL